MPATKNKNTKTARGAAAVIIYQHLSDSIRIYQNLLESIRIYQNQSESVRNHQNRSESIRNHQNLSEPIRSLCSPELVFLKQSIYMDIAQPGQVVLSVLRSPNPRRPCKSPMPAGAKPHRSSPRSCSRATSWTSRWETRELIPGRAVLLCAVQHNPLGLCCSVLCRNRKSI